MLHLAAGVYDLQHKLHTESDESENDRDLLPEESHLTEQGHPSTSNGSFVEMIETVQKPPGVDIEREEIFSTEENSEECFLREIEKLEEVLVEFSSSLESDPKEKLEKSETEGKGRQVIKADIRALNEMESACNTVEGVPHFRANKSPLPKNFPISFQDSLQRDARSDSPDSQTSDVHSSNSTPSSEGSPTEVKEESFFQYQRPSKGHRDFHNGHHESLMTDSGIYDHDLLDSDSSDSTGAREDMLRETRAKVIDKTSSAKWEGHEGHHALAVSEGDLEKGGESEFYSKIINTSSPIKLVTDDSETSQQRPNSVDLSWYDSVSTDFYLNSAFKGNVNGIAEFDPAKQGHYIPEAKANVSETKSSKSREGKIFMLIEEPKRKENTDSSLNTDEDELAAYIYDPQLNDSYNMCLMKSQEFLEDPYIELHRKILKEREEAGDILEDSLDDPLEDPNFALPTSPNPLHIPPEYDDEGDEFFMQVVPPFGDVTSKPHGVIDYKFEMHDTTWGVSSGEAYFDLFTGQRILSTIYEFEVSSDEDTDSYRLTESRLSDVEEEEEIRSFRKDSLEEDLDMLSRDTASVGGKEDGGHTSQPGVENVAEDERDLLKSANESEKPSLPADRGGGESSPRDTSMSDACIDDGSQLIEGKVTDISDKMECKERDSDYIKPFESHNDSNNKCKEKVEYNEHSQEKENDACKVVIDKDESNLEKDESSIEIRDKNDTSLQLGDSCSDSAEIGNNKAEGEFDKDPKLSQQTSNDLPESDNRKEDFHDISIVVTTAEDDYDSDEDFFSSDAYITSYEHSKCNSSAEIKDSNVNNIIAHKDDDSKNTLEVMDSVNALMSDDDTFQSDAETDVTYVSNHENGVHHSSNGHHDVANIVETNFSDSDDDKNAISHDNCTIGGSNTEKQDYFKICDSLDGSTILNDDASDERNSEASFTDTSNNEAEAVSCHETEALATNNDLKKFDNVDVSSIEADVLSDNHGDISDSKEKVIRNNNEISDPHPYFREIDFLHSEANTLITKLCNNCDKGKLQDSQGNNLVQEKILAKSDTDINKIGNPPIADDRHFTKGMAESDPSLFTPPLAEEKHPVIESINYTEEVTEDLRLPPGGVTRLVCVCCETLIVQDSLLGASESVSKDGESEDQLKRKSSKRESSAHRTAALVAEECKKLNVNIGYKQKIYNKNLEENDPNKSKEEKYLTGDEFEICVPDLPPAKPKRLFLRRFSSEPKTSGNTSPVPLFDNTRGHPNDPDLTQPPIKPKRRRHSPMSPPRKMKKNHQTQMTMTVIDDSLENEESFEKQIDTGMEEHINENIAVVDDVDVGGGSRVASYSGSSSLDAETAGESLGKRVGTGPDPRDPSTHHLEPNTNSSVDEDTQLSPDEHEVISQSHGEGTADDHDEREREEKAVDRMFNRPVKVSEIIASMVRESHRDSTAKSQKLSRSSQNENECMEDEERTDSLNNKDVYIMHRYPSGGEAGEWDGGSHGKPVTGSNGEEECHKTTVVDNTNVLRDITNETQKNVGHSTISDIDTNYHNINNELENKEVAYPRPPRRKKRSHSFNTLRENQHIHFVKPSVTPTEEVIDQTTPPKVPPRTYRRYHSLPRRPKTQVGVASGRHSTGGVRKAVGRSASTATCRPHTVSDQTSSPISSIAENPLKDQRFAVAQDTPSTPVVKLVSIRPHTPATTVEVSKNKRQSEYFRRKSSFIKKHYFSLPRNLAKKFNGSDNTDDPTTTCFPYLFPRKQKDIYDFTFPSSHPSEIPEPEPYARAPSTGSVESFSNLFTFYSSMEHYKHDNNIENPFTKNTVTGNTGPPQTDDVKTPPQPPPRRNKKHSPAANDSQMISDITELECQSITHTLNSVNMNETEVDKSKDLGSSLNAPTHDDGEIPLSMESSEVKENVQEFESTEEKKLPSEIPPGTENSLDECNSPLEVSEGPQVSEKSAREFLNDSGIGILQEDFETKLFGPPELHDHQEEEEEQSSHEIGENQEDTMQGNEVLEGQTTTYESPSGDSLTEERLGQSEKDTQEKEITSSNNEPEDMTPTTTPSDPSLSQEVLQQSQVFWTPPNVALQTWAERQGVEELEFTPLSLRRLNLEKRGKEYGSLKERGIKSYTSMGEIEWNRDFSQHEKEWKGYQSLENLGGKIHGSLDDVRQDTPSPGPPVDPEKEENQQDNSKSQKREEDRVQKDRCIEVYPETVRQRQRNTMTSSNKVDIKNWTSSSGNDTLTSPSKVKKFLPSVKALRNQFETGKTNNNKTETNGNNTTNGNLSRKSSVSNSSVASSSIEKTSSTNSLNSGNGSVENLHSSNIENSRPIDPDEPVEPIFSQFKKVDEELRELMSKPPSTTGWNPRPLLKRLYYVPDAPKHHSQGTTYINIEGYLEKLPSGRKKATFWNAWKRRYFVAKDGVLYYYQNPQADKASMKMTLMGGKVECMEPSMVGVDDGKGHYVVVRCSSKQEAERWRRALETHTVEDFASQYVQPWPIPTNPTMLRDTLIIDLGSSSVRAGVLASQATLPQVFVPSVVATERETRRQIWGFDALSPDVRSVSSISFPIRPSHKISKYSVDLSAVSSLLQKAFADLKVDPKNYNVQLSVPRILNPNTQAELLRVLFDKYGVKSVNLTHQSILALYAYNATSGIVVDIGERLDIVPVIDGYIVDGGVSRVPYGGYRILDHLRQFLYMRNISLINEVESYIIRHVLENICYCAHHYNTEKARCTNNPDNYEKGVSLAEYFPKDCPFEYIALDFGRFQATEGLFNPDAWGLDHPGIHKLVHKAIMECSMDIRKEMSRSIFLAGGVTQLPGLVERLTTEIDNLTPPAIRPKVHASPYRYHAAYIGACVLAESPAFTQSRITREDWNKHGNAALKKWSL